MTVIPVLPAATSQSVDFRVLDNTSGLAVTTITAATAGLVISYQRTPTGAVTTITLSDLAAANSAWSSGGIKHKAGGVYRLCIPDAAVPAAEGDRTTIAGTATAHQILGCELVGKPVEVGGTAQSGDSFARIGAAGAGLTSIGDTRLANLDAAVSTRSTYAGADTPGTGTLLARITALLQTKAEADTAHGLLATAAAIAALNNLSSAGAQAAALAALAAYPVPLIADIEAAIAAGAGATPATFWAYTGAGGRTLSQSMIAILSSMIAGSSITITRGDSISVSITGLGSLAGRTGLWFTVKANPSTETDLQARVQITELDGLIRLNGKAAADPTDGSIVVDDIANGDITITLTAEASAALARATSWHWDVQVAQPGPGIWTPRAGTFVVTADVTRAT